MVPLESLRRVCYLCSIVTMVVCGIVFEIKRDIGRKNHNFSYSLAFDGPLGGPRRIIDITFDMEKLEWCGYPMVKKFNDVFNLLRETIFRRVMERHRQTDRQTSCDSIVCAMHSIAR